MTADLREEREAARLVRCPRCGGPMIVRHNGSTGVRFFGCLGFPYCRRTLDYMAPPAGAAPARAMTADEREDALDMQWIRANVRGFSERRP